MPSPSHQLREQCRAQALPKLQHADLTANLEKQASDGANTFCTLKVGDGDQHRCTISLGGAHVVSWVANGKEQLYMSETAKFDAAGKKAFRGGIPILWPAFGNSKNSKGVQVGKHGFARITGHDEWRVVSMGPVSSIVSADALPKGVAAAGAANADADATHLCLAMRCSFAKAMGEPEEESSETGDGGCELEVTTVLSGDGRLTQVLRVRNRESAPEKVLSFTGGFHTYFAVDSMPLKVRGPAFGDDARSVSFRDGVDSGTLRSTVDSGAGVSVSFDGAKEVERIYHYGGVEVGAVGKLTWNNVELRWSVDSIPDCVFWNIGTENFDTGKIPGDMYIEKKQGDGFTHTGPLRYVCVEPAVAEKPVELRAGGVWEGWQQMKAGGC